MDKLKYSVDGGQTWIDAEGIRVIVEDQFIPGEDVTGDLVFNFTHEGLITDVWMNDDESLNIGTKSEMYDDIIVRLVEDNT